MIDHRKRQIEFYNEQREEQFGFKEGMGFGLFVAIAWALYCVVTAM